MQFQEQRKELGLSQQSLAVALGVEQSTVSRWERTGEFPRVVELAMELLIVRKKESSVDIEF